MIEDFLKNAFYFNLRIFTEYKIGNNRVDLVIVETDPESTEYLGDCVTKILSSVEIKYKDADTSESKFYQDIEKIISYIDTWGHDTRLFFAFLQEKYFKSEEIINWIEDEHIADVLYAYWDEDIDETIWKVVDY